VTGWTVLAGFGKTMLAHESFDVRTCACDELSRAAQVAEHSRRMLKKAVQQGRRRVETGGVPSGVR
jgi:hypothetical protein